MDAALLRALSRPRLGRYLADSNNILDAALSLYERNARLSEAFHLPLQTLEVCLRNHMNEQLDGRWGPNWYRITAPPFEATAAHKLDEAMGRIEQQKVPVTQGGVVAELSFGFWVTLLGSDYDRSLWTPLFSPVFAESGKRMKRKRVHSRMNSLRNFRNRVAHHEPIYHLDPALVHADIIQATAWICPDSAAWILEHSRVATVLARP